MTAHITGVDHCVILVRDLDSARERMRALGFLTTPRGTHSDHMGTGNYCIMLRKAYFEILGVLVPREANARWRKVLEVREGLNIVALATDDAAAARAELVAAGLDPSEPLDFARPVDLPEGPGEASFRVALIPEHNTPGTNMFVCQHFTPELVWHASYVDHANGAEGLRSVTVVADDPAALATPYGRIFGDGAVTRQGDSAAIDTGDTPIHVLTPAGLAGRYPGVAANPRAQTPYLAGLAFDVADRAATAACFAGSGVAHAVLLDGGLCVAPADACGTLLEFV